MSEEQNIPSLCASYDLHVSPDSQIEQFVYASSLYGTSFGVFAVITADDSNQIKSIRLKVYNYVGVVNIGFAPGQLAIYYLKKDKEDDKGLIVEKVRYQHRIKFFLQGGSTEDSVPVGLEAIKEKDIQVLVFERILYPMAKWEEVPYDMQSNLVEPIDEAKLPKKYALFDNEFFYRNGTVVFCNQLRPGMNRYDGPDTADPDLGGPVVETKGKFLMPSARCHKSYVRLIDK